jgi:hypothetical protein
VPKNLTLAIDEDLVHAARKIALDRKTSVNTLVRDFLEKLVSEAGAQRQALADIEELFQQKPYVMGKKNWTREDLHERKG